MKAFNLAALAALAGSAAAQTFSACDPTKKDGCPADSALGTEHTWYFNETLDTAIWNMSTGSINYVDDGAEFTLEAAKESTLLQSNFYIFFGVVESWVKMAKGPGIISSVVLESDDLDEIDWEWVGYNTSSVQTNFFGKGNDSTFDRGGFSNVANADTEFHNYTTYWDQEKLEWYIDNEIVRTLKFDDKGTLGGKNYPETPCRVKVSVWPAGTVDWAGGLVNYDDAPFTMTLQKMRIKDFHTGKEYTYGDKTGDWQSIKVADGNSTTLDELNKPPKKSLSEKWDDLGTGAHVGVYVGASAAGVLLIAGFMLWCLRQRRKGRLEYALDDARYTNERTDAQNFQNDWKQTEWRNSGYRQVS
ncbi:hypothetical protein N7509_004880 [Penicillium cosmopolitanum]|uniref:chitinase n=1 Tax=Penicillium cosmopolitanum TaxID=1131564 RepID=A0A9X0B9K5_9EURO|nr:uncharacterized protein N7509_004880 [Penicillium cosmopolitanum]KAJ5396767.1 hypothetical protein N7509_004880 [Penicillium cosmopolitanum]